MTHKDGNTSPMPLLSIIARSDIIWNIKLEFTFKPGFTESEDVNITLFHKDRYFDLLISADAYVYICQF